MQLDFQPFYNTTYNASLLHRVGAAASVHYPNTSAPASLDSVVQHTTWRVMNTGRQLKITWRARGTEELAWAPVTTPINHGGFIYYIDGLTASAGYGRYIMTYLVEFRGRK